MAAPALANSLLHRRGRRAIGVPLVALPALAATTGGTSPGSTRPLGGAHLLQLLELRGGEDFFEFGLHLSLEIGHLLFLLGGEFQDFLRARRQQAGATCPLLRSTLRVAFWRRRRAVAFWRRRLVLGG